MIQSIPVIAAITLAAGLMSGTAQAAAYTYADLSTLGGANSHAKAINNFGQIVGYSDIAGNTATHATLWNGSAITDLGHLGGDYSLAYGINDLGQIVGSSTTSSNGITHATLWSNGSIVDLDPSATVNGSTAYAINNSSQIVGESSFANPTQNHATLWSGNTKTDLGSLVSGQVFSRASDINDAGQIVGVSSSLYGGYRPTFWNSGSASELTQLGSFSAGAAGEAFSINTSGQIAGYNQDVHGFKTAATWDGGSIIALTALDGGEHSWAYAINQAGQVVGSSNTAGNISSRATLWSNDSITDLNDFLDADLMSAGWTLTTAEDINDNGWIIGKAYNSNTGQFHAFLLTPVPEPESYAMMLVGLSIIGVAVRRRRKKINEKR